MSSISRGIRIAVTALLIFIVAVVVFIAWGLYALVPETINYVTQQIAAPSGMNPYLVRGIVILVTIPFFWALAKSFQVLSDFATGGGSPRLSMYKNIHGMIVVAYIGVFYLAMYFSVRNNFYKNVCVSTPEGLRNFVGLKQDPTYGLPTHPCTLPEIVELRRKSSKIPEPHVISVSDVRTYSFFDSVTGQPKVWYFKLANGTYILFNNSGDYPGTGQPLKPMDEATRDDLIKQQQSALEQHLREQSHSIEMARESAAGELINSAIQRESGEKQVAILIFSPGNSQITEIESEIANTMKQRGFVPVLYFFKPAFLQDGRAEKLLNGDWSAVEDLDLNRRLDLVIVGSAKSTFSLDANLENITSADTEMELHCLNVSTRRSCGQGEIESVGAGSTQKEALENSYSRASSRLESFSRNISLEF